jgi:hypothetical protein
MSNRRSGNAVHGVWRRAAVTGVRANRGRARLLVFGVGALVCQVPLVAADSGQVGRESPWLLTPTVSSDPKVGTTLGLLGGYLHKFDAGSVPSMLILSGKYSDTDSWTAGLFGQFFFDENRQRAVAGAFSGKIRNDYEDFLESGLPAQTTDDLDMYFLRYLHRAGANWYLGAQAVSSNYAIGADAQWEEVLDKVGLTGFDSNGIGVVAEYDTRDNLRNPRRGSHFMAHNVAYRESFGGDESFDVYNAFYNDYRPLAWRNTVLASQLEGRWTDDAPPGGYSSLSLRGYVRGQSLAPNYTHLQTDARIPLAGRWVVTLFGGLACLYDSPGDCGESENLYPAAGAGVSFLLKVEAGLVLRAEYAVGKEGNSGLYLRLGNPF